MAACGRHRCGSHSDELFFCPHWRAAIGVALVLYPEGVLMTDFSELQWGAEFVADSPIGRAWEKFRQSPSFVASKSAAETDALRNVFMVGYWAASEDIAARLAGPPG